MTVSDPRLERWLESVLGTPGQTGVRDPAEARRVLVDDSLAAAELVEDGPVVDVGSGGGSPGIPVALCRPELHVDLLEAQRRKCDFLQAVSRDLANVSVVCARAEEHGRGQGRDAYGTALAQALAPVPVAVEWCLPLIRPGGRAIFLTGDVDLAVAAAASEAVGGGAPELVALPGTDRRRLLVVPKLGSTPERFPRRPGAARKRPLA